MWNKDFALQVPTGSLSQHSYFPFPYYFNGSSNTKVSTSWGWRKKGIKCLWIPPYCLPTLPGLALLSPSMRLHQDIVRAQRSSGCQGSFLQPLSVPKSKPDPSGLCIWVLTRWWDLLGGTVPSVYRSELWMMNAIDHLICEWHLNMLKVI